MTEYAAATITRGTSRRMGRGLADRGKVAAVLESYAIGVAFLLPLVFWPPAPAPFSSAKRWLLLAWVVPGLAVAGARGLYRHRRLGLRVSSALAIWIAALALSAGLGREASLEALTDALLPCGSCLLLLWIAPRPRRIILALVVSATLVALLGILQCFNLDPYLLLRLTGSLHGSSRIRVFSTLGNPNFVASFLVAVFPLTLSYRMPGALGRKGSCVLGAAALIQAGAIVATGSRAPILAFVAVAAWLLVRTTRRWIGFVLVASTISAAVLLWSPARPLETTVAGRVYIWKVILTHITEIPAAGFGPGAFALRFAQWETDVLRTHAESANRSFAGLQDHAHNDYLEILVDHGTIGLAAFFVTLALLVPLFPGNRRAGLRLEDGMIAALITLLAIATVDFPLHRPADLYLLWTLVALLWSSNETADIRGRRLAE
jgi:O-antigen ligase